MSVKIIIPSYKRAGAVKSLNVFCNPILYVDKSELSQYKEIYPDTEIVAHSSQVIGISRTIQAALEYFNCDVFFLDDDVTYLSRVYLTNSRIENIKVPKEKATAILNETASTCRELGAFLFAFGVSPSPIQYRDLRPFNLSGGVTNGGKGVLKGSKIYLPQDMMFGVDQFMSCINAYYHRKIFRDNRFAMNDVGMTKNRGGCANHRNKETELQCHYQLKRYFGKAIALKGGNKNYSNRKAKYEFEKTVNIPF